MKVLSAAATLALVFAERPLQVNKEQSSRGDVLGICCLKAKDYTDGNNGRKKELSVEWVSSSKASFNPSKECLLTSTIPVKDAYFQDQSVDFGMKQVWPTLQTGHLADETCAQMMERYQPYHDEIIKQANADKAVDDKFREGQLKDLNTKYNAQMAEIHKTYRTKLVEEAGQVKKTADDEIKKFINDETTEASKLKNDIVQGLQDLEKKDNDFLPLFHTKRPADDMRLANEIQAASEALALAVFNMVAIHNQSLISYVEGTATQVKNRMAIFNTTSTQLNGDRTRDEQAQNDFKAKEEASLADQARDEETRIRGLEDTKGAKAPTAFPAEEAVCTTKECCCTIMFNPGQAMDVKVPTNFLNWDQCQFAGEAPVGWFSSHCPSYMTDCQKCKERPQCQSSKVQGCTNHAKQSVDLKPKEMQPVVAQETAETVVKPPAADIADVAKEDAETGAALPAAAGSNPPWEPPTAVAATPPAVDIADGAKEDIETASTPLAMAKEDVAKETVIPDEKQNSQQSNEKASE